MPDIAIVKDWKPYIWMNTRCSIFLLQVSVQNSIRKGYNLEDVTCVQTHIHTQYLFFLNAKNKVVIQAEGLALAKSLRQEGSGPFEELREGQCG